MAIEVSLSFWAVVRYWKNGFFSIKALFSLKLLVIMLAIAFLKVQRSMNHKKEDFRALIEADLGAEYKSANSPNPSPASMFLFTTPFISTANFPSWRIKNELAIEFCFMRYCPSSTLHNLKLSKRSSLSSLSYMRLVKVKWFLRLLRMSALSLAVFFWTIYMKFQQI